MKFNFCPNISLPENKQRIKEIGLEKFYQEYYKNTFNDISPDNSIINKLFVDIDKFTDSQQSEIVESIIYEIEQGKKEGFNTVQDLFDYARDSFRNTKDAVLEYNTDGSWDNYINIFNNIDSNWDKFRSKVEEKLKGIGVKITKSFVDTEVEDTEETSDNGKLEFTGTEAAYQRDNYDDGFQFSRSSKDTASAHLKLKLSLIPEVEYNEDGNLEPSTNFLNLSKFMPLDKVWNSLQRELTGLEQSEVYSRIEELAKENPMYGEIYNQIMNDPNTAIQNEFIVTFSKQQAKFATVKQGYGDKSGNRTIKVFGTNRQGAGSILIEDWYDKFKNTSYVNTNDSGELVVNKTKSIAALNSFNKFLETFDPKKDITRLGQGLAAIGINLSPTALTNFSKYGVKVEGVHYSAKEFTNKNISLLFKRLAGSFTETEVDDPLSLNNPFLSEVSTLEALANVELTVNPFLYEGSFISGDGKSKYSYVNNSYISRLFTQLQDENYINELLGTTYASTSMWLKNLINDPIMKENFGLEYYDTLGTDESNAINKPLSRQSTREKEYTRIGLYQNQGRTSAKYLGLIPSDKTTLPIITATRIKVVIDMNTAEIRNREALDALYTPFLAEYKRILDVQKQQNDPTIDKIVGYHNGMGEKFLIYDFLNKDTDLFDKDGNLQVIDTKTLKDTITPKIIDFAKKGIRNQVKYWDSLSLDDYFDKSYKSKLGDYTNEAEYKKAFAADYFVNQFLAGFNYTQVIGGDPALHGKKSVDATWINYSKRLAKDIAPGLDGNFVNPNYRTIFLKDLSIASKQFVEYLDTIGDKAKAYLEMNPADAQEYTTLKEHLAVMDAYGKLTPELKAAGQRLLDGGSNKADLQLILQPMKPVQVGTIIDKDLSLNKMYYIKTSSFPLVPALTRGLEIDKLRVAMENNNIDRAVYESGVKLGLSGEIQNVVDENGIYNDNIKDTAVTLDRSIFRIQQEIPYHGGEEHINEGSQARKLILLDVNDDDIFNISGKQLTGRQAKDLYENLHVERINRSFTQLLTDVGASNVEGSLKFTDLSKLQDVLIEEATSRNYNINDIYGLQIETVDGKQRFKIPLGFNNSSGRLESIMNSLVTNRVIKQELTGFAKVQGSSVGFSKVSGIENLSAQTKENIIWLNPNDTELNYIRLSDDKKTLLQADILVPSWFKGIDLTKYVKEDGTLDTDKLPEELLSIIGIRIPTQGYNSIMSFKVKGFLPKYVGDLAIVPSEIVVQMGSDFDVDKMFIYRYAYNQDASGNLSKVAPATDNLKDSSDDSINNGIIQFYEDRYKDPRLYGKILEPNGFGKLPELSKQIASILKLNSKENFLTPQAQNLIHKNNNDGKAGVGIFSLFSTFIRTAQDFGLKIQVPVVFKVNDKTYQSYSLYNKGIGGATPSSVISYFQSAAVDNAKEQILGNLNINSETMGVAGTIALTGFDESHIAAFLSQPIIREYVEMVANNNDITNSDYNPFKYQETIESLVTKYEHKFDGLDSLKEDNGAAYSLDDMMKQLVEPVNEDQVNLFSQFLRLKDISTSIQNVQSAINTDTKGLGARYVDLQTKAMQITSIVNSLAPAIINSDKLFIQEGTVSKSAEVLNNSLKLFSQILPYNTESYKQVANKILDYVGKGDAEFTAEELDNIYKNIRSHIFSNPELLGITNSNEERQRLLFGSQALGNRWETYKSSPAGKKNRLAEAIKVRRGDKVSDPIRIEAINSPAANQSDTNEQMASFYRMYYKGNAEEKALAEDLVKYFIVTGANQGPTSISKFIPYDILEENGFSNKLHDISDKLNTSSGFLNNFIQQFFQHNPKLGIKFDTGEVNNYNTNGFNISQDSKYVIPVDMDGENVYVFPQYMSIYDKKLRSFLLYSKASEVDGKGNYTRIDTLGDSYTNEYNFSTDKQYSIFKSNQSNTEIPTTGDTGIIDRSDNTVVREQAEVEITPKTLSDRYKIDHGSPEGTLNAIIANSSNLEYVNIAKDLKRVISPNLGLRSASKDNISGSYVQDENVVEINTNNIWNVATGNNLDPNTQTERVILHEILHAISVDKLMHTENLSDKDKKTVDKINILYKQYTRSINSEDYDRFNKISSKIAAGTELSEEEAQFFRDNKSKYYPLRNVYEFVAAGLTDDAFSQELKNNNFWEKLWSQIQSLLGLSTQYKNDYDALYSNVIDLASDNTNTEGETLNDLNPSYNTTDASPKEQKKEFLSRYHLYDGKPMNSGQFDRINTAMKANTKYNRIRIDFQWENGQRVLRVSTKGGTPLYDIDPQVREKSKEEKFVDKTIKTLTKLRTKLKSAVDFGTNVGLQAKVEDLNRRIKAFTESKSADLIISDAKDRLAIIGDKMLSGGLLSAANITEFENYLNFYKNIRNYISYTEDFATENEALDEVARKSIDLLSQLKDQKKDTLKAELKSRFNIKVDIDRLLNDSTIDVGYLESNLQSAGFSSSQQLQVMQYLVNDAQLRTNESYSSYTDEVEPILKDYLKKYRDYNMLLQRDSKGKFTGRLLNKYSQDYYDALQAKKGDGKAYWDFYKANTKIEWTEDGKELWKSEVDQIKDLYPAWDQVGTHDHASYNQFISAKDPNNFIRNTEKGKFKGKEKYLRYLSERPLDKWIDPDYKKLKLLPESDPARKAYDLLDNEFRSLAKKYGNQVNYIPEVSKDLASYFLQGNIKGGFNKISDDIVNSLTSPLEPKFKDSDLDINGVPHDTIPVYFMNGNMEVDQKSLDLGNVLLLAKQQEFALQHKAQVEPYLIMMKEVIQDLNQSVTNRSNQQLVDDDGNPIVNSGNGRNKNMNDQARWILEDYLYNKGSKHTGYLKNATIKGRVVTGSKIVDNINTVTRMKGMGLNIFSGVGNIYFGLISNAIHSGDRKSFGEKESVQALGIMLNSVLPGTEAKSKVAGLMKYFDVLKETNEIKYGKSHLQSSENPLKNLSIYEFQKRGEYFVQGQTAMAMLLTQKVKGLDGKDYTMYDAFDSKGKWDTSKFGPNIFDDINTKRELMRNISNTIASVHGDYANGLKAKESWMGRAALVFRTWIPQSVSVRFGKEYQNLEGDTVKGRYRSYELSHLAILPLIKDAYKAFTTDRGEDTVDTRNLRMNMIELAFIPILWSIGLMLQSALKNPDDDKDKELLTFLLNSTTRAQGDLTFFFNPYSFQSVIREPVPAFKTLMDVWDLGPAIIDALERNDTYANGPRKGKSKIATKLKKVFPIINQPDKLIGVTQSVIGNK